MISTRFGPAIALVTSFALVPTLIHSYVGLLHDDGHTTAAIGRSLAGLNSEPLSRSASWVHEVFQTDDWIERRYVGPGTEGLVLFVARSYDPKRLYHHPELALLHGSDLQQLGTHRAPGMQDVAVHVLRPREEGRRGLVVYSLLYDDRFVDDPYRSQLRTAWKLLFSGRKPMTLFWVHDPGFVRGAAIEAATAVHVLHEAIRSFLGQTPVPHETRP